MDLFELLLVLLDELSIFQHESISADLRKVNFCLKDLDFGTEHLQVLAADRTWILFLDASNFISESNWIRATLPILRSKSAKVCSKFRVD